MYVIKGRMICSCPSDSVFCKAVNAKMLEAEVSAIPISSVSVLL